MFFIDGCICICHSIEAFSEKPLELIRSAQSPEELRQEAKRMVASRTRS